MSSKKKLKARYSGPLQTLWRSQLALSVIWLLLDVALALLAGRRAALIGLAFTALYLAAVVLIYMRIRGRIMQDMVNFATEYGQVQKEILKKFVIPTALLEPDGKILWMNEQMSALTGKSQHYRKNISTLLPEINYGVLPVSGWERDIRIHMGDQFCRAHMQRISMKDLIEQTPLIEQDGEIDYLFMLYLFDETELTEYIQENRDQRPVVGLVYIDNYEEVMERTDEVYQSLFNALVERKISQYFTARESLVKKLEKDKYLVVLNLKTLDALKEDRFSIIEAVKTINIGNGMNMTVSGGIGTGGQGYMTNYELARSAIEMALGRGGDQFVIRDRDEMTFFGGKTQSGEKSTRVKARVKAQALRELMISQDQVVIMGHALPDMDALGAAIGVYRAARTIDKPAHIVLGELNTNIRDWVQRFRDSKDYEEDLFIDHEQALRMVGSQTVVVVVDTNRPSMTECPDILSRTDTVVVLDHHRQNRETVENAALSYIETSASSASEMVAEILQYFDDGVRLRNLEADCLYAGILIDTNSFAAKTGVRTFEAAAYLRRSGADVTRVRKALRDNLDSYMARADAVSHAETYMDCYALAICHGEDLSDPTVIGAQAANDLLNIVGVRASFVVTQVGSICYISARSIDEINVQLVMERLGGGGHLNTAGAQLHDVTAEEALAQLKEVLRAMTDEGII